ncbi:DUF1835 domain-containing protein [Bacillus sp. FJAT-49705]|uniref:DUF1835 domain-containing protein n=1 Tax=Cytobacillus citreus TaxID=2833586 RepID=A0ABS5NX29_9BACI|nr:DUF1835 domain-containing protein [Cytobacillus citreus]
MKTKINFPFIYFFMEPNVVFVYKIETQNYVTVSDFIKRGQWETFELDHGEIFDMFNHEVSKPLEGKGYFINEVDLNIMVEEINKHIQKNRHSLSLPQYAGGASAVHIITSESAAGSLRVGLERPKVVIGFPDCFSIGPLWKLDEKIGQAYRNEWLQENINFEQDDYEYQNKFTNTLREIEDIPTEVPIYIWYGNNADEQTGLRFFLNLLRDKTNEIFLINSTDLYERYIHSIDEEQPTFHTSQIESRNLRLLFEQGNGNQPLSDRDRIQFQREWETLSLTSDVLRLWINGEIIGVSEHYYDPQIISTLEKLHIEQENKDFIQTGRVIGETLQQMDEVVNVFFLEYRIRHLVYSGVLELKGIPKSMRHYRVKLR